MSGFGREKSEFHPSDFQLAKRFPYYLYLGDGHEFEYSHALAVHFIS